jgi:endonuclease/exonuclease/phosphatase family metal-dependent hydrolase
MRAVRALRLVESTSVLLFFLQALRVIFSVLFGIIYDQVFEGPLSAWLGISVLLLLAALVAPAALPRNPSARILAVLAAIAALARVSLCVNDAGVRYWGSLVLLLAAGLYLAGHQGRHGRFTFISLVAALAADQVLRALGQTYDLSLRPAWLPVQVVWAAGLIAVGWPIAREKDEGPARGGLSLPGGLAFGGLLFLEVSLLSLPNAAARWGDVPYAWAAPLLLAATLVAGGDAGRVARQFTGHTVGLRAVLAVVLITCLLVGYFVPGPISLLALVVAQMAALLSLRMLLSGGSRASGRAHGLGLVVFLLLNFLNAFAFTYPYTLPGMRGMGWAVYLAAAALTALGRPAAEEPRPAGTNARRVPAFVLAAAALILTTGAAWPIAADPLPQTGSVRLATYNMHYGYDDVWHLTLEEQARLIESDRVDVIALQEVDTGRLTSYGVDDAVYLARRLRMNVAYLPAIEHLTGIAVLYRGPAVEEEILLLPSLQEQTGIVRVDLEIGETSLSAHGIWMGLSNEDTLRQIRAALDFIGDRTPASFGGDFNAEFDEAVPEEVLRAGFIDPFTALGIDPVPLTDPALDPEKRIDFVWLRGLEPRRAWVPDSPASDHRMVVVEVGLEP